HPKQTQKTRIRRAPFAGQILLDSDHGARIVFWSRSIARANEMDREVAAREIGAHGLLRLFQLFERELLLWQHAMAPLPQLVAHQLALLRQIGSRLSEIDDLRNLCPVSRDR